MAGSPPEQLSEEWRVKSFAPVQGFGTLVHASGEETLFSIDVWNTGSWKPTRKELAVFGDQSPLLPREGEPVHVIWKRSPSGKTVPAQVQPTGRTSNVKEFTLTAWLEAIRRCTGKFARVTPAQLIEVLSKIDEDLAESWRDGELRSAEDFGALLVNIAELRDYAPEWAAEHATWIYQDDWRWDRERAQKTLPAMLGIQSNPAPGENTESLGEYAQRCNQQAAAEGRTLRLCDVDTAGDFCVLLALRPDDFAALVEGEYLAVIEP